ncbi:serine hydrolase domain-containing protein [Phenylobacterium sp.]|uniref:serine hydrolase domain-containing protein n=1 Tax=Phenylobacterium sp. TaxID=1871053 RepID=UPI002898FC2C|nr:serine hydrolase domain-containing protein [Phenylobacterium sp.]
MLSADQVGGLVAPIMQRFSLPGLGLAIVRGDDGLALGFGVEDSGRSSPVGPDTAFQIASCGKAYTATAAATLVDADELGWDTPVRDVLPEFRMHDERLSGLATVRDLLSMRLGYLPKGPLNFGSNPELGLDAVFERLGHMEVGAGFREQFIYLNPAYALLAEIVSRRAGQPFGDYLARAVTRPLGQTRTFSRAGEAPAMPSHALPHVILDDAGPTPIAPLCGGRAGEGCIYSTPSDAVAWLRLHLGLDHVGLVSQAALTEMRRPQSLGLPSPLLGNNFVTYGFGWQLRDTPHGQIALHEGVEFGVATFTLLDLTRRTGVAVYANRNSGPAVKALAYALIDALAGRAPSDWVSLFESLAANERAAAAQRRERLLSDRLHRPPPSADMTGAYLHPAHGVIDIVEDAGGLELRFRDARAYNAALRPIQDNLFEGRFLYPGMRALTSGRTLLRVFSDAGGPALDIADIGVARKLA